MSASIRGCLGLNGEMSWVSFIGDGEPRFGGRPGRALKHVKRRHRDDVVLNQDPSGKGRPHCTNVGVCNGIVIAFKSGVYEFQ